jgi:hypothetical protein
MHDVLDVRDILLGEFAERRESGYEVGEFHKRVEDALERGCSDEEHWRLLTLLEEVPRRPDWLYDEPSDLRRIATSLPQVSPMPTPSFDEEELRDRIRRPGWADARGATSGSRSRVGTARRSEATSRQRASTRSKTTSQGWSPCPTGSRCTPPGPRPCGGTSAP